VRQNPKLSQDAEAAQKCSQPLLDLVAPNETVVDLVGWADAANSLASLLTYVPDQIVAETPQCQSIQPDSFDVQDG
jgi:hypothetical protein